MPTTTAFKPYSELHSQRDMNLFCRHVKDTERAVREGRWNKSLVRWANSHLYDEDFEQLGFGEEG